MIPDRVKGLDLVLVRCRDGWSYEWQDQHGRVVCCGWSRGTKREGREEAHAHLREAAGE